MANSKRLQIRIPDEEMALIDLVAAWNKLRRTTWARQVLLKAAEAEIKMAYVKDAESRKAKESVG